MFICLSWLASLSQASLGMIQQANAGPDAAELSVIKFKVQIKLSVLLNKQGRVE